MLSIIFSYREKKLCFSSIFRWILAGTGGRRASQETDNSLKQACTTIRGKLTVLPDSGQCTRTIQLRTDVDADSNYKKFPPCWMPSKEGALYFKIPEIVFQICLTKLKYQNLL